MLSFLVKINYKALLFNYSKTSTIQKFYYFNEYLYIPLLQHYLIKTFLLENRFKRRSRLFKY